MIFRKFKRRTEITVETHRVTVIRKADGSSFESMTERRLPAIGSERFDDLEPRPINAEFRSADHEKENDK